MTPAEIKALLHYYTTPGDYPRIEEMDIADDFVSRGLLGLHISSDPQRYGITDKGRVLVDALCKVEDPVHIWVCRREEITKEDSI